jgi:transcriptional regulator with XRE-family HTH domain
MALSTGERIRLYRTRRGLSRERLSGLAGVSPSWLKQVENGTRKADSLRLLVAVAEALNMPVWDLIPGPRRLAPDGGPQDDAITRLEDALLPRVFAPQNADVPDLSAVRAELDETWIVRYSGLFGEAARRLAVLIPTVEAAVHHDTDGSRALELYAEVHWLTAYTLFRAGERGEHSRIAADRFVTAARRVGDPLLMAASARCLGHVLLHEGKADAARTVLGPRWTRSSRAWRRRTTTTCPCAARCCWRALSPPRGSETA